MTDKIVKNLNFGQEAKDKVFKGIDKLTKAVSSTLGASGQCVILDDDQGKPASISHYEKKLGYLRGPQVVKTFE